jgi:hypothetical protein
MNPIPALSGHEKVVGMSEKYATPSTGVVFQKLAQLEGGPQLVICQNSK